MRYLLLLLFLPVSLFAQQPGRWRGELQLGGGHVLPFEFDWENDRMVIINGEERLPTAPAHQVGDSLHIASGLFNSEFRVAVTGTSMTGVWIDRDRKPDYRLAFSASFGEARRFEGRSAAAYARVAPRWEIHFSPGTEGTYPAIGLFTQKNDQLFGTFATETGDYRFLAGNVDANRIRLSAFDGAHAFLFEAELGRNDSISGTFFSGKHWKEPFSGKINPGFELRDPDSLTFLKPGYDRLEFTFPTADSQLISLADARYQGKVVLVQVLGTWCPNCMDETRFLTEFYPKYQSKGFEVIGLAFERSADFAVASAQVRRMTDRMQVPYPVLIAGVANKTAAAEKLPALNHIMSYPTAILIDKQGRVRRIHTGFYGPGTGDYYLRFTEKFTGVVEKLLAE